MPKIAFLGAGSTIFAKNVLGDCLLTPALADAEYALHDIDVGRLEDSRRVLENLNANINNGRATLTAHLDRREALADADYVVNAIQVGGYEPCTVIDFEIPKKYGLRQTIGDTLGIGGIFRAMRSIPILLEFAEDMEELCPAAWFLNYSNPMAMLTGAMLRYSGIKTVGLCHSVQVCIPELLKGLEMETEGVRGRMAGINHMAWLLEVKQDGVNLYPEIKRRAEDRPTPHNDMVRYEIMKRFGHYVTESSEHNAEYVPWFIKSNKPELIERFAIPLDEYPRRCVEQIEQWSAMQESLVNDADLSHERTHEYGSFIIEAMETGKPFVFGGNVLNEGCIPNLPGNACVEVSCVADGNGIVPTHAGELPPQLAALNMTNINVHLMTIEAALTRKREALYQAAFLDPHCAAELTLDEIVALCDDLIEAHGDWMPPLD